MGAIELALLQQIKTELSNIVTVEAKENIPKYSQICIDQNGKAVTGEVEGSNIEASNNGTSLFDDDQYTRNWAWCQIDDTHWARVFRKNGENGARVQILEFDFTNCSFFIKAESDLLTVIVDNPQNLTNEESFQAQIFKAADGVLLCILSAKEYDGTDYHYGACVYKITYDASFNLTATKIWLQDGTSWPMPIYSLRVVGFPYSNEFFVLYYYKNPGGANIDAYVAVLNFSGAELSHVFYDAESFVFSFDPEYTPKLLFLSRPENNIFYVKSGGRVYCYTIDNTGTISALSEISINIPSSYDWLKSKDVVGVVDETNNLWAIHLRDSIVEGTLLINFAGQQYLNNDSFHKVAEYIEHNDYTKYCTKDVENFIIEPFVFEKYKYISSSYYYFNYLTLLRSQYNPNTKEFTSEILCHTDVPVGDLGKYNYVPILKNSGDNLFVFTEKSLDTNDDMVEKLVNINTNTRFFAKKTYLVSLENISAGETGKAIATEKSIKAPDATPGSIFANGNYICTSTGYLVKLK